MRVVLNVLRMAVVTATGKLHSAATVAIFNTAFTYEERHVRLSREADNSFRQRRWPTSFTSSIRSVRVKCDVCPN